MKKYLNMILAVAASVICFSCTQEEPDGSQYAAKPTIEIVSKDDVFAPEGGEGIVEVKTNEAVTAKATGSWLSVEVNGSIIKLTATPNETIESRYSILDISAGDAFSSITIQQSGKTSDKMWEEAYTFAAAGGDVSLAYSGSGMVRVSVPQGKEWISTELYKENNEDYLKISVEANLYKAAREGQVCFVMGSDTTKVGVVQAGNPNGLNPGDPEPKEFIEQSVWTPKYYGISPSDDTKAIIGVEAEEGSSAGRYFLKVVTAAEYNAVGDQFTYLNLNASAWAAENPEICRDTDQIEIDLLSNGSYYLYAIGVDNDGKVNYKYAVAAFSVTKELSPYDKFLGTWSVARGSSTDTWTVTEKEAGKSYYITGIDGKEESIKVVANFNSSDGTITVDTQPDLGQSTVNTSAGEVTGTAALYGRILYNNKEYYVTGDYNVFTATISSDASTASLTPGEVTISAGDFTLIGFAIYTITDDGAYAAPDKTNLPITITHLSQGEGSGGGGEGGGGGGGGDTSGYNAWLGTWNVGSVSLTISQKTAGSTYTVSGLEPDIDFEARYANGNLEFFYQVIAASGTQEMCLFGIDDDGDGYIVEGDPANDGWLATATLNSAGTSASLVGAEFDAVYSGTTYHERIVTMQILVYDDSDGKFYYVSDEHPQIDMPTTMTKASTSAVSCRARNSVELSTGVVKATPAIFSVGQKAVAARKR